MVTTVTNAPLASFPPTNSTKPDLGALFQMQARSPSGGNASASSGEAFARLRDRYLRAATAKHSPSEHAVAPREKAEVSVKALVKRFEEMCDASRDRKPRQFAIQQGTVRTITSQIESLHTLAQTSPIPKRRVENSRSANSQEMQGFRERCALKCGRDKSQQPAPNDNIGRNGTDRIETETQVVKSEKQHCVNLAATLPHEAASRETARISIHERTSKVPGIHHTSRRAEIEARTSEPSAEDSAAQMLGYSEPNNLFRTYLNEQGKQVISNPGLGNNCAIYALIQLLRPNLNSEQLDREVFCLREQYDAICPFDKGKRLYFDDGRSGAAPILIDLVNRRYEANVLVTVIEAGFTPLHPMTIQGTYGIPARNLSTSHTYALEIWDQQGHYEAVISASERAPG